MQHNERNALHAMRYMLTRYTRRVTYDALHAARYTRRVTCAHTQVEKGSDIALHFTDMQSCRLILNSMGIRASTVGQLGGGVSVCLRSIIGFDWGNEWYKVAMAIGKALWGSKWYEVMPGAWHDIMPDLEDLIRTGKVQGAWPAARDEWGEWASKLETVLLVEVPAEEYRSADRIVPGRDDVYIIPQSTCDEGKLLNDWDTGRYYSNTHIKACLVLKPPISAGETGDGLRVCCTPAYDTHGSMVDVKIAAISNSAHVSDERDTKVFPPRVLLFTATIAKPVQGDIITLHRRIEKDGGTKKHWLENTARFKRAEMAAGLEAIDKALLHAYTIAYVFASRDDAEKACGDMGLIARKRDSTFSVTVSLRSPAELGWEKNAGGHFRQNVAELMNMEPNDVQTVIICAIPTQIIQAAGCGGSDTFTIAEREDNLKLLLPVCCQAGKYTKFVPQDAASLPPDAIYSCAHIAKIYALEAVALVEARRKLKAVLAGAEGSEGDNAAELERTIQEELAEASKGSGTSQGSGGQMCTCGNQLMPDAKFCRKCGAPAPGTAGGSTHAVQPSPPFVLTHVHTCLSHVDANMR